MVDTSWHKNVVPGTRLVAVGTRNIHNLTKGREYVAIHGREDGIFEDRPYVTVITDEGNHDSFHLSRFLPV